MTIDEFLYELNARFPKAPLKAWAPDYRRELAGVPPAMLRRAFDTCLGGWTEAYAPKPAHFLQAVRPLAAAQNDAALKEQWRRREQDEQLARDKADPIKRAQLDALIAKAKAHLSSASPSIRPRPATIFKPLPAETIERIRREHGQDGA